MSKQSHISVSFYGQLGAVERTRVCFLHQGTDVSEVVGDVWTQLGGNVSVPAGETDYQFQSQEDLEKYVDNCLREIRETV